MKKRRNNRQVSCADGEALVVKLRGSPASGRVPLECRVGLTAQHDFESNRGFSLDAQNVPGSAHLTYEGVQVSCIRCSENLVFSQHRAYQLRNQYQLLFRSVCSLSFLAYSDTPLYKRPTFKVRGAARLYRAASPAPQGWAPSYDNPRQPPHFSAAISRLR